MSFFRGLFRKPQFTVWPPKLDGVAGSSFRLQPNWRAHYKIDKPTVATIDPSGQGVLRGGGTAEITVYNLEPERGGPLSITVPVTVTGLGSVVPDPTRDGIDELEFNLSDVRDLEARVKALEDLHPGGKHG